MEQQQQPADGNAGPDANPSKRSGKTFLISVVVAVVVAVTGGAAAAYVFFPEVNAMITGTTVSDATAPAEPVEYGEFMELAGFMVNPAGTEGRRALMVNVGLEGEDEKALEGITRKEVVVRDRILAKLSKLTVEELSDYSIRDSIKQDMLVEINRILDPEAPISRLYFTAYILQ